jgi:hypothetical protein
MSKIKSITFLNLMTLANHSIPEAKRVEASSKMTIEMDVYGVVLTWQECDPKDAHVDISKNPKRSTFIPIHMVHQVEFEKEEVVQEPAPKKPGRPLKK